MEKSAIKTASHLLTLMILGLLIYSNTFEAPFVFDDIERIQENPEIRIKQLSVDNLIRASFGEKSSGSRPVANMTFALNYYFNKLNLTGFHIVNISVHILSGLLLYLFIKTTLNNYIEIRDEQHNANLNAGNRGKTHIYRHFPNPSTAAFFTALIWLVNPLHTQSVTYIVQRQNSMAAMFYILSLIIYVKARTFQKRRQAAPESDKKIKNNFRQWQWIPYLLYCVSFLTWLLALGSKQISVTLPFFVFLYEWYFFQNLSKAWFKKSIRYLAGILLIFFVIVFIYLGSNPLGKFGSLNDYANNEFTMAERLLTQPRVVIHYLSLLFYPNPSRLNLDHNFPLSRSITDPITTLISILIIAGLLFYSCKFAERDRLTSFSILWFFGNLAIESSIIPLAIIFEHRTYLPSMLVFLPVVIAFYRWIDRTIVATVMICISVLVLSIWTYQRNQVWRDDVTLYSDCIEKSPEKARPYYLLGMALESRGKPYDAVTQYLTAIRIRPEYHSAHNNLAMLLNKEGSLDDAIRHYQEAIKIEPRFYKAYNNLGNTLSRKGLFNEALEYYIQALKIKPDYMEVYPNMGLSLEKLGRVDEAVEYYRLAIQIDPEYADAYYSLGIALLNKGDLQGAVQNLRKTLELDPDYPNLQMLLNRILQTRDNIYNPQR